MTDKELRELEELASKFIIDYKELSSEQKRLMIIGKGLQIELNKLRVREKRIITLIDKINDRFLQLE